MWAKVSKRDKLWFLMVLLCILYFMVFSLSECLWVDGPFAFVRGCQNFGIDWNAFMAPIGFFIIVFAIPFSSVYWLLRILQLGYRSIVHVASVMLRRQ